MKFCELTEEEYSDFGRVHPLRNFMNSIEAYRAKLSNGWFASLLGVKDKNGAVIAATIYSEVHALKLYRYVYLQRGMLADYRNTELLAFFTEELRKYAHARKGLYMICDPPILVRERDIDGAIIEGGYDNMWVVEAMKKSGWEHRGFNTGYDVAAYARFMFTLPLTGMTEEQVYKQFHSQTRWSINKTLRQGIQVRELGIDEIEVFLRMMDETAKRREFYAREHEFFINTIKAYGEHGKLLTAYLDIPHHRAMLEAERQTLAMEVAATDAKLAKAPASRKFLTKKRVAEEALQLNEKNMNEADALEQKYGSVINMAVSFFSVYDNEVTYIYSGTDDRFRKYNAPYALQWHMIKYAVAHGIPRYNFYGISGDFRSEAKDYGIYDFKRGFSGVVEENIGDFMIVLRPAQYRIYEALNRRIT